MNSANAKTRSGERILKLDAYVCVRHHAISSRNSRTQQLNNAIREGFFFKHVIIQYNRKNLSKVVFPASEELSPLKMIACPLFNVQFTPINYIA